MEGSTAENRSGGLDPETPRRYSDMMTYQPATFRDLPIELRLMIWDTVIESPRILWYLYAPGFGDMGLRIIPEGYRRRQETVMILMSVHYESRHYAQRRFWIAPHSECRPCWPLNSPFYLVDLKADTLDFDSHPGPSDHSALNSILPVLSKIRTVAISFPDLHTFLSLLYLEKQGLPALRRIYVKTRVLRRWDRSCDIPTLPSAQAGRELELSRTILERVGYWAEKHFYSTTVQEGSLMTYGGDLYVGKYIDQDDGFREMSRTFPKGWETISLVNWPILKQMGLVCVFIYEEIDSNTDRYLPAGPRFPNIRIPRRRVYVFSTTRGPMPEIFEESLNRALLRTRMRDRNGG